MRIEALIEDRGLKPASMPYARIDPNCEYRCQLRVLMPTAIIGWSDRESRTSGNDQRQGPRQYELYRPGG